MADVKDGVKVDISSGAKANGVTIEALFKGMEGLVQTKTVVGEPMKVGDATIIPLVEVSAGLASGTLGGKKSENGAGAMSAKISPVAVLVLENGRTRLINVKNQDVFTRIMDLIPEAIDKIQQGAVSAGAREEAAAVLNEKGVEVVNGTAADVM